MYMYCYRNFLLLVFISVYRNWILYILLYLLVFIKMMMKFISVSISVVIIRFLWNYNVKGIYILNMKIVISCAWVIIYIGIIKF